MITRGKMENEEAFGDEEVLKALKSTLKFQDLVDEMGGLVEVIGLYTGKATSEQLLNMHKGAKRIVEDYDPDKEMTMFEKTALETGLGQVQMYLRNVLRVVGDKSKKCFSDNGIKINDEGKNYCIVTLTPIEKMIEDKSGTEIKTSLAKAVDTAYKMLQQG